jgi:RNA polymerase sigma factor (sigma-70 family)
MAQARIERILACIESGESDDGWAQFLMAYSPLLRSIVRRFETDETRIRDCYEYVCAGLSDDGFNRLSKFDPDGRAEFRTWLTAVVSNLCRDWRRAQFGRYRVPEPVLQMSEFEQLVFELVYRQGLTQQECMHILDSTHPGFNVDRFHNALARLHLELRSQQRWRLSMRPTSHSPVDPDQLESGTKDPESAYRSDAESDRLERALARLGREQRLLLQLRYQQDLTLREIARLLGFPDPFAARRAIDKAMKALRKSMRL